jgi:tripartite-type tricarboxylate transporter receptor subunit TctC/uncharacterized protein with PIN domain
MIVVDSSALIAILENESDAAMHAEAIRQAERLIISIVNAYESSLVLHARHGPAAADRVWRFLQTENDFDIVAFDQLQAREALAAFGRHGKGIHPARLNLADCAAYALAKIMKAPLLFKGNDFSRTDIQRYLANSVNVINTTLYEKLNFVFVRDIAPVATIAVAPDAMVVNPSFPVKTVPEFIAYAKANPGKINMASAGNGSPGHVEGELFKMMAGVNMVHVPYRGGAPALTDLLGRQVQVYFGALASSIENIRAGRLRALAVTSRVAALPDIPTVGEFVPGYEGSLWTGIGAPRNTPIEIIERLNREINVGLADPKMKARLAEQGSAVLVNSPADFAKLIANKTEKWAKVVKFSGARAD